MILNEGDVTHVARRVAQPAQLDARCRWYKYHGGRIFLTECRTLLKSIIMNSLQALINLRLQRLQRCQCYWGQSHQCGTCRRVRRKLCKAYHVASPIDELAGRLTFEYVFGIINIQKLLDHEWLRPNIRDFGHTKRLTNICKMLSAKEINSSDIPWINVRAAMNKVGS